MSKEEIDHLVVVVVSDECANMTCLWEPSLLIGVFVGVISRAPYVLAWTRSKAPESNVADYYFMLYNRNSCYVTWF